MKIALAADLHFGSVPVGLSDELREAILRQEPDAIVIAGDLTLRARREEFEEAANWLQSLSPSPLVIPGNHDLPYFNLLQRFTDPFRRFQRATGSNILMPVVDCPAGRLLGLNTTRSWQPHFRWQEGVARRKDVEIAAQALSALPQDSFKAVAAHHPLLEVEGMVRARPVRRARQALQAFAGAGVELIMSGHTHQSFAVGAKIHSRPVVFVGAPTALSLRMRGEENGFWIIEITADAIVATLWLRQKSVFRPVAEKSFKRARHRAFV